MSHNGTAQWQGKVLLMDLVPENFKALSSLVMTTARQLEEEFNIARGDSVKIAYVEVARTLLPEVTAKALGTFLARMRNKAYKEQHPTPARKIRAAVNGTHPGGRQPRYPEDRERYKNHCRTHDSVTRANELSGLTGIPEYFYSSWKGELEKEEGYVFTLKGNHWEIARPLTPEEQRLETLTQQRKQIDDEITALRRIISR